MTKKAAGAAQGKKTGAKALRLHGTIAQDIGRKIVSGRYRPGQILDGEIESSEQMQVSRSAYREAVRILAAKGLLTSRPRVGTRVSSPHEWHLLDPDVLAWIFHGDPDPEILQGLFELRGMVEPEAAAFAAARRTQRQLDSMRNALDRMREHTLALEAGRIADQEFHAVLLSASGNPFIISLTNGVAAAVHALTEFKQRNEPVKRDPMPDHERVFDAIQAKDAEGARKAMRELIRLAVIDTPIKRRSKNKKR